ncbi:MAG: hypothetical protein AMJ95_01195 [Omnitrophica WOR_2 bacterium SM23_72]|nr:MAG: hypothetical protein AMJ95_01195 [Omnitrophica WOR_2 bacterium SM23_72]
MNIKLIFPPTVGYMYGLGFASYNIPPYGMGILSAFLRRHFHFVEQEDLLLNVNYCNEDRHYFKKRKRTEFNIVKLKNVELYPLIYKGEIKDKEIISFIDEILDSISVDRFNLTGFSIFTFDQFLFALLLSKRLKQRIDIPIVFGGAFITLYGQLYPEIFNFVDYTIIGDGGIPLLRLIDYLNNKISIFEVPNLIYKKNGKLIANPKEYYPLEDMPVPEFDGLPMELYRGFETGNNILLPYQITSGCSNKCSFCTYYINDKLEFKSYNKVVTEIRQMKERYNSNIFYFCDNLINNSYDYLEGLCDSFIENKLDICWSVYVKFGNLDSHILKKMKEAGCQWLKFGIESGSNNVLNRMHKGFTSEQAAETLKCSHEVRIKNQIFLLVGYPYETDQDINRTILFIENNKEYISKILIYKFQLEEQSLLCAMPNSYEITKTFPRPCRFVLSFDELKGLKWNKKFKQQEYSARKILKTVLFNGKVHRKYKNLFIFPIIYCLYTIILSNEKIKVFLIRNKILNNCFVHLIPQKFKNVLAYFQGCFIK